MKRTICLILCLLTLSVVLVGCTDEPVGESSSTVAPVAESNPSAELTTQPAQDPEQPPRGPNDGIELPPIPVK